MPTYPSALSPFDPNGLDTLYGRRPQQPTPASPVAPVNPLNPINGADYAQIFGDHLRAMDALLPGNQALQKQVVTGNSYAPGSTPRDPWHDGTFQSAGDRLAAMTNHTGAYAPIDPAAQAATQRVMSGGNGVNLGSDFTLPSMSAADRSMTALRYAPRVPAAGYTYGMPTPTPGAYTPPRGFASQ